MWGLIPTSSPSQWRIWIEDIFHWWIESKRCITRDHSRLLNSWHWHNQPCSFHRRWRYRDRPPCSSTNHTRTCNRSVKSKTPEYYLSILFSLRILSSLQASPCSRDNTRKRYKQTRRNTQTIHRYCNAWYHCWLYATHWGESYHCDSVTPGTQTIRISWYSQAPRRQRSTWKRWRYCRISYRTTY